MNFLDSKFGEKRKFVFIGGAGSGKSELALNLAAELAGRSASGMAEGALDAGDGAFAKVELFDMDQTKPLFRSRELSGEMEKRGVRVFYQDQYLDSPQAVGGVEASLAKADTYTILDVGGDKGGALMIGRYAQLLKKDDCIVFYVINPFRPWSEDIYAVDATLSSILAASRLEKFHILVNPNVGEATTLEDWEKGVLSARQMLGDFAEIEAFGVTEDFADKVKEDLPLLRVHPFINYGL